MASSWSYAYDQTNCPSGIFYAHDPRENVSYETNQGNSSGPPLDDPRRSPFIDATNMAFRTVLPDGTNPSLRVPASPPPTRPQSDRFYLPALRVSAKVSIKAMVAQTVVTQSFQNLDNTPIERAGYSFPLYEGSVLYRFKCFVGKHRVIEGVVEPKKKANAEFEKAVARQRVAAMLEERTPEIFETQIGSIPAKETIKVEVSYASKLKVDLLSKDAVFVLPMSIASRYGTPPDGYSGGNSTVEEQGLEISVDVSLPVPIASLASRSHPISVTIGSLAPTSFKDLSTETDLRKGNATLSNRSARLEGDFILLISPKEGMSNTRAFMEPHPEFDDHSAIMVNISPQDFASITSPADHSKCEVLFVIDCSGSMEDKVNDLRTAMRVAIRSLPEKCFFNMCLFGSDHELLWEASQPATQENSDKAFACSAHLTANKGGTELRSALEWVITSRIPSMDTNIIVVTDGETWDMQKIHTLVRKTNEQHGVRFFCLGIGNAVSHALVEGIGRQGGGLSEVVTLADSGKWELRVIRLLKGALTSTSWHITLRLGPLITDAGNRYSTLGQEKPIFPNLRAPPFIQAPFQISKLHTFSRLSVFFLVNNSAFEDSGSKIYISAESSSGEIANLVVSSEKLESTPSVVHFFAAHAVVKDLENKTSWLHGIRHEARDQDNATKFQDIVKKEAEAVGKTWSIVGEWTSFIAVEKSGLNSNLNNLMHLYRAEALQLSDSPSTNNPPFTKININRGTRTSLPQGDIIDYSCPESESEISEEEELGCVRIEARGCVGGIGVLAYAGRHLRKYRRRQRSVHGCADDLPTSDVSIEDIISDQFSTGCFVLRSNLLSVLLNKFDEKFIQQVESELETQLCGTEEPLLPTVLAVVYLEMRFQEQLELLELVIDKAKGWLEKTIPGEKDKILEIARGGYVGNGIEGAR